MPYPSENVGLRHSKDNLSRTTKSLNPSEVEHQWFVIDGTGLVLGRAAAIISMRLRGKHKPQFTPHVDCGDRIIVINAEQVTMTGNKLDQDILYRHTGHSGGIKSESSRQILEGRHPQRRWKKAVQRMMPRNLLCRDLVRKNLYVYAGPTHPHAAQKPEFLDVASFNSKNVKRPAT